VTTIKRLVPALSALVLAACAVTPKPATVSSALDVPKVAPGQLSEANMKKMTRVLSSDAFEGRAPGTPGEDKTVAYIIDRFRAAGLQPGNKGSWVQRVPLVEIAGSDHRPLTITGGQGAPIALAFARDWVGLTYRQDAATRLENSELVFVGYGVVAPEKGWNDYAGIDMRGKTAVILVNDPDFGAENETGLFNGRAMTYYGRWTYKYEEAARQGAAGAIIVHDTAPAAYGWNVVESSWTGPQLYADAGADAPPTTQVNGWMQKPAAERVLAAAGHDLADLTARARQQGFRPVPLGLRASTSFRNTIRKFASQNVIGILPGRTAPEEYVLHTAHWDHLGRCTPAPDGDDICNGAIDNATGTAALAVLGEAHAKAGPARRSLVFLAVTAEESGLLGAHYYAANPVYPLAQTVGGINMDAFLMAGPSRDVIVVGHGKSELENFLAAALEEDGRYVTPDPSSEAGYYYRSDHFAFAKRGVPMLYADGGEDLVEGGRAAGAKAAADYRANRYHGPKDEYDPAWNWGGVMQDLQLFYRIGRSLAESTSWPNWMPGDEFRAIRDQDCARPGAPC
jgi:Zn-dependent M28 family amino/carboxypeptidase